MVHVDTHFAPGPQVSRSKQSQAVEQPQCTGPGEVTHTVFDGPNAQFAQTSPFHPQSKFVNEVLHLLGVSRLQQPLAHRALSHSHLLLGPHCSPGGQVPQGVPQPLSPHSFPKGQDGVHPPSGPASLGPASAGPAS